MRINKTDDIVEFQNVNIVNSLEVVDMSINTVNGQNYYGVFSEIYRMESSIINNSTANVSQINTSNITSSVFNSSLLVGDLIVPFTADTMTIGHVTGGNTKESYALSQDAGGYTHLNAEFEIELRTNNIERLRVGATGVVTLTNAIHVPTANASTVNVSQINVSIASALDMQGKTFQIFDTNNNISNSVIHHTGNNLNVVANNGNLASSDCDIRFYTNGGSGVPPLVIYRATDAVQVIDLNVIGELNVPIIHATTINVSTDNVSTMNASIIQTIDVNASRCNISNISCFNISCDFKVSATTFYSAGTINCFNGDFNMTNGSCNVGNVNCSDTVTATDMNASVYNSSLIVGELTVPFIADTMTIGHVVGGKTKESYALSQDAGGYTHLNASYELQLRTNNIERFRVGATGIVTLTNRIEVPTVNASTVNASTVNASNVSGNIYGNLIAGTNITLVEEASGKTTVTASGGGSYTGTAPIDVTGSVISVNLDTVPTASSTDLINSGNLFTEFATKQDTLTTSSNIIGDALDIGPDTALRATIGYTVIHSPFPDQMAVSHIDHATTTNYSLIQNPAGKSILNRATGQTIDFREGNTTQMSIKAGGDVDIMPDTDASVTLGRTCIYSAIPDFMSLSHFNRKNVTDYAIAQNANGITYINCANAGGFQRIVFLAGGLEQMRMSTDGYFGIGTSSPAFPLSVYGNSGSLTATGYYFSESVSTLTSTTSYGLVSAYIEKDLVVGGAVGTASDSRIKKDIVDVSDVEALQKMRDIKPRTFKYIDNNRNTNETVYGYIAQEVHSVFPEATKPVTDVVPNINAMCAMSGNVITMDTTNLETDIDGVVYDRLIVYDANEVKIKITFTVVDDTHIEFENHDADIPLTGDDVFVYGQEVDNFLTIEKSYIACITTSAVQEVDKLLTAEKAKTALLETQMADVLARLTAAGI